MNHTALLEKLKEHLVAPSVDPASCSDPFLPFTAFHSEGSWERDSVGEKLLKEGKCGCVIAAGGQGSRFRFKGPKGCFPLTLIKQKSLFALFAEKTLAASKKYGTTLQLAIMTSPLNHAETNLFFQEHHFFGLLPSQVSFFPQPLWPVLDFSKESFCGTNDELALGPNGNGALFESFYAAPVFEKWKRLGIEFINFIPIDNPLADPFDKSLFGFCHESRSDVVIKAIRRSDPGEKVGVIVEKNSKPHVVEYSEIQEGKDDLKAYPLANCSLFCFTLSFIKKAADVTLPIHVARKAVQKKGESELPKAPNAWKFETFIFDALYLAETPSVVVADRKMTFAPLKNFEGTDSIASVQAALIEKDRHVFTFLTGKKLPQDVRFELAQDFYYPTQRLIEKWKKRTFPGNGYLDGM